ncbi:hypothetical protein MATL_G00050830 [Megalops atlanticus]|uniref:C-type lectin domain-containing protein n=1 Tax=Megalops atlanticus TaxID=7932 RepID=A0A9D3QE04_MEGAT|nr:hypothetical protein MATL_G00050830 [Megalops atlanticus]
MSEGVFYSALRFKKDSSREAVVTQGENVTYSEVKITDSTSHQTVSQHGSAGEKSGQSSHRSQLTTMCLGLLCALLLTAIIALCVFYTSLSQRYSAMERDQEELRANYSHMSEVNSQLQRNHSTLTNEINRLQKYYKKVCKPCPQGWEHFNSKCYYFTIEERRWQDSRSDCQKQGADLVIIESNEEQEFITKHTMGDYYWIGLTDSETEGTWLWVDRTPLQKGFWRDGEPDNSHTDMLGTTHSEANCVVTVPRETAWVDTSCHLKHNSVCETDAPLNILP